MAEPVYLDHNATAPVRPEAARAVADALTRVGNASSVHRFGRDARRTLEDAREAVAGLIGARAAQVVFTGSGTEANNLALQGVARPRALVSAGEHDCVLRARGDGETIPLTADSQVDLDALAALLARDDRPAVVSVMLANNETGVLNDVARAAEIAHGAGALFHCDAVQAPGKLGVDVRDLGVDLLTLSAHKIGGPQGVGALVLPSEVPLTKLMGGGGQERGYRPGTENVAAAAGFGAAAELAARESLADLAGWRERLERTVREIAPHAVIHGRDAPRLPTTSCIGLPGVNAETQVMALDLAGVAVSSGSACSSGKVHPSHVLRAMGLDEDAAGEAIRVSLGWNSRESDVDRFLDAWAKLARRHMPDEAA